MSYQPGYPQQTQNFFQPHNYQPGYQGGLPEPEPEPRTSPATAIVSALLGLAAAAALVVVNLDLLGDLPAGAGFGDLPGDVRTLVILRFAAAAVLVLGAILLLARKLAGAMILLLGAGAGTAAVLLYPTLHADALGEVSLVDYLKVVVKFETTETMFTAAALIASALALIFAILPPTLNHLRSRKAIAPVSHPHQGFPDQTVW